MRRFQLPEIAAVVVLAGWSVASGTQAQCPPGTVPVGSVCCPPGHGVDPTTGACVAVCERGTVLRGGVCVATRDARPPGEADDLRSASERSGFFFAGGIGAGAVWAIDEYEGTGEPYDGTETWGGGGASLEAMIGGSPAPGIVLGFGIHALAGAGDYADEYQHVSSSTRRRDSEGGGLSWTGANLLLQVYVGAFYVRAGLGGGYLLHLDAEEGTGGVGGQLALGASFPVARSLLVGFSVGAHVFGFGYDDDEYRGFAFGVVPSARLEVVVY